MPGRREIGVARGCSIAGHLEQVGADRVEPAVVGEPRVRLELPEQVEPCPRSVHHRGRDGMVQLDERVVGQPEQDLVQGEDLRPVCGVR